ncbi:MAG: ATP-binding cassette domain-containing protein [Opitutales bacterium]
MLRCENITVHAGNDGPRLLNGVSASFAPRGMHAIVGPSGCGKTTLVKSMLGLMPREGMVELDGVVVDQPEQLVGRVGFAPQFSIAQPNLTVDESLAFALRLTVGSGSERKRRIESILRTTGLEAHRGKRVSALSGGQLRRLGLGLEFALEPPVLICDEVTSGLDPNSEDEILDLLRSLVQTQEKTFINIIHNLGRLGRFDSVCVLYGGVLVFQGPPEALLRYLEIEDFTQIYDRLEEADTAHWAERWAQTEPPPADPECAESAKLEPPSRPPLALTQLFILLWRRSLLFVRDRGYLGLSAAITFGFPCIVVIFALGGLGQLESPPLQPEGNPLERTMERLEYRIEAAETGQLATGLILFQVILLTLMGSNNGAREIAGERQLYEKERLSGLSPLAFAGSKLLFVAGIALFQGFWMTAFVKKLCYFPGDWGVQLLTLGLCCLSMTWLSLGMSAIFRSPDKASLLSIYFVGFQLPLSGIVLALPEALIWVFRPFINAYWSWAGYASAFRQDRLFDAMSVYREEAIPVVSVALAVLLAHCIFSTILVVIGCQRRQPI